MKINRRLPINSSVTDEQQCQEERLRKMKKGSKKKKWFGSERLRAVFCWWFLA